MSEQTKIQWCDSTVNFWSGCTKVSAGCANCYAEARDKRHMIEDKDHWGKGASRLKHVGAVKQALAFNRRPWICDGCGEGRKNPQAFCEKPGCTCVTFHRRRIFSLSLGDWLDEEVPVEWLAEMLDTIRQCDQVIWILCTKRPEMFFGIENSEQYKQGRIEALQNHLADGELKRWLCLWANGHPPKNIWLLTSVEDQAAAYKRIPELLRIPAVVRGLSLEPLLEPVSVRWPVLHPIDLKPGIKTNEFDGLRKLNWLIIGGESGPNARPCNVDSIRFLVAQGKSAGVATFVKQLGSNSTGWGIDTKLKDVPMSDGNDGYLVANFKDKKGGDPAEWPAELRVQQWPA